MAFRIRARLPRVASDVPLVGRTAELALISGRLGESDLPALVLAGSAGVGKTRLAAESMQVAARLGYATARVVATKAAASIPFGPFAPLLPDADIGTSGLLGLLRSVSDAIVERAGPGQATLLVVDDAHLLDDASAALVHQWAQRPASGLIATVRTPGPAPDPITALWKDGLAERVDLAPLSESEVAEFATSVLGGPTAGASVRQLWELSAGNALYLRELIRGAAESGALTNHGGMWILRKSPGAPERLVELLGARLADLPPGTVDVVDVLAVAGSLGLDLLDQMTSAAAVEDAEQLGLVQVSEDGRRSEVRLAHPLYGEVRRQRLPKGRLRRLRGALADALEATGARRREDLLLLASWQQGGGRPGDPATLTRAAKRARGVFDMDLAARLATAALESGGGTDAGLVLAITLFTRGAHTEADELLRELTDRCENDTERAAIAGARSYNRSVLMGDPAGAIAVVEAALAVMTEPAARLDMGARAATISLFAGQPAAALTAVEPALASGDDSIASRGYYVASCALALLGRTTEAVAASERGLELHRRVVEPIQIPEVQLVGATLAHAASGGLTAGETAALTGYQACLEAGDREGMATFSLLAGCVRVAQGNLPAAARAFREGAAINRELNDTGALRWCLGGLALAEGLAGDRGAATAAIAELDQLRADWMLMFACDVVERGRAWAMASAGETTAALRVLREAAGDAAARGELVAEARLLHDVARLGDSASVRDRLGVLAALIDGDMAPAWASHAAELSRRDAAGLESVSTTFAELGALLLAAEAVSDAAAAYADDGRSRQASACLRKAAEYAAASGSQLPERAASSELDQLTRREREIAALAAAGTSSKDIAAKLFISLRTVDNHLQRIYSKFGVNGRDQLRAMLSADD
jgi:DNA-binding CsgD family transcriptional regulator